jgi:NCS2 family nucleobase:cation symporter-2/xanthine permease XanP
MSQKKVEEDTLLFAANDKPPHLLSALLGFQMVALILSGIVLVPLIALSAAGADESAKSWAVFAALFVSGAITILQSKPVGPFGSGFVLFMGTSGAFISISIAALQAGGLPLLGSLVIASSLIQFLFSKRLGLIRKIITPTVGGTVITLIAIAVMPIAFELMNQMPKDYEGTPFAAASTAGFTIITMLLLSLFGRSWLRLWGPVIGVISGSFVASFFGLVDFSGIINASFFGFPNASWPGLDLRFNETFWVMLPGFMIVTIIGALETYGDGIAIQHVSQRGNQPTDFKAVQGAINADGLGNLLSGLMGTLPNTTYSTSISVAELTGVAAKRVGVYGGLFLMILALSPKVSAILQAIPAPVAGSFIFFLIVLLFVHGIRLIASDGFSFDNSIIFGISLWAGYGFQAQLVFHDLMPDTFQQLLDNGMTSGGMTALLLSLLITLKQARPAKLTISASDKNLHEVVAFARQRGEALNWSRNDLSRLELATEEAFLYLVEKSHGSNQLKIQLMIRSIGGRLEIELISAPGKENIENLLKNMQPVNNYSEEDLRIRILSSMVDQLSHQQFNEQDFLSITIGKKGLLLNACL